jgi:SAM-dependent methyltransferase
MPSLERAGPCPVCDGTRRTLLYEGVTDHLAGTPGAWSVQRCEGCGTLVLDPRYSRDDIARAYENYSHHLALPGDEVPPPRRGLARIVPRAYLAHAFGYHDGLPGWLRTLALLAVPYPDGAESVRFSVMYLRARQGGELLDVGCGGGAFLAVARELGWRVVGVDPDERAVQVARETRDLDVRAGTLEKQRFEADRFDAVTASHVIEHVHDPLGLLRECLRVAKPGAQIVIVTPNSESLGHRRFGTSWIGLQPPRHLYLFACDTLRRLADRAGMRVLSVRSSVRNADFTWLLGRGILRDWPAPGQPPPPGPAGWCARGFQLMEWALTVLGVEAGEEIVLVGTKP